MSATTHYVDPAFVAECIGIINKHLDANHPGQTWVGFISSNESDAVIVDVGMVEVDSCLAEDIIGGVIDAIRFAGGTADDRELRCRMYRELGAKAYRTALINSLEASGLDVENNADVVEALMPGVENNRGEHCKCR